MVAIVGLCAIARDRLPAVQSQAMKPKDTKRILDILDELQDVNESDFVSQLDSLCGEDRALREELLSYLQHDDERTVFPADFDRENEPESPES